MKTIFILIVKLYQTVIAPVFPSTCKFEPTCSKYAIEAIEKHGALKGAYRAARRILRCNPYSKSFGYDPVD